MRGPILMLVVVLAFAGTGCSSSGHSDAANTTSASVSPTSSSAQTTPESPLPISSSSSGPAKIGGSVLYQNDDPVDGYQGVAFTVYSVRYGAQPSGEYAGAYGPAEHGQYVAVDVGIEVLDGSYEVNASRFTLIDPAGHRWTEIDSTAAFIQPDLSLTTLNAGRSIRGWVAFDVPKGRFIVHLDGVSGAEVGEWK